MQKVVGLMALLCACLVVASVPEPSFVITGWVNSSSTQVKQDNMVVTASHDGNYLAESTLNASNQYTFALEIPLEANVGAQDTNKARVNDSITLRIAGEVVGSVTVTGRGEVIVKNIELPSNFDTDGDGIYDALEIANGHNPSDPNDPVQFGNQDVEGDGIPNGYEFFLGTYDPDGDQDRDGFSNQDEYAMGTNPNSVDDLPLQVALPGQFSAVHPVGDGVQFAKSSVGSRLVWDESVNGKPTSIQLAYWDVDPLVDLLVATDQGKVFVLTQIEDDKFNDPSLISLFSLPVGGVTHIGFADFDGINAPEMWAYSKVDSTLYLYQRSLTGQPFGQTLWTTTTFPAFTGGLTFGDVNNDGAIDMLVSGIDMSTATSFTPEQTIALFKGSWDGYLPSFAAPTMLTQQSYVSHSNIQLIPNIGEIGYDRGMDLIIRRIGRKFQLDPSFNGLSAATSLESFITAKVETVTYTNDSEVIEFWGVHSATHEEPFIWANIDENESNGIMDLVQYSGALDTGSENQFRILRGIPNTHDSDGDGIPDYKDLDKNDPNKPMPNGNLDYDLDGVPYAADANRSGLEDADNDGINDAFELRYGLDPNNASDQTADPDNDGRTNYEEFMDGTNPLSRSSVSTTEAKMLSSVTAFQSGVTDMQLVGAQLAVASQSSKSVQIYNLNNLSQVRTIQSKDINGVSKLLNAGNLLVLGNMSGDIEIWDVEAGSLLGRFAQPQSSVTDMAVDGNQLYTLHADGNLFQFNIETLAYVGSWDIYDGFLTSILARNGILYIQASNPEKVMFVWSTQTQQTLYTLTGSAECCEKVVAELVGDNMLIANSYSTQGLYSTNMTNYNPQVVIPNIDIETIKSRDADIYIGRKSGVIERYSAVDGSFQARMAAPYSRVREIELTDGGFISLHADGNLYFWESK